MKKGVMLSEQNQNQKRYKMRFGDEVAGGGLFIKNLTISYKSPAPFLSFIGKAG